MCTLGTAPDFVIVDVRLVEGGKILWGHTLDVPELSAE
jgi:hypothetical protein